MKSKKSYYLLLVFMAAALLTTSCRREGCIFPNADNYDPKAKEYDNSCIYSAEHVIFFKRDVSQLLIDNGIYSLYITTKNSYNSQYHSAFDWSYSGDINDPNCIVLKNNHMTTSIATDVVTITDGHGHVLWEFDILFESGHPHCDELLCEKGQTVAQK